jgi:predicted glycosyltransferase
LSTKRSAHILVSPLDWGLGHTTRCVPIINYLLNSGNRVTFAGNDWQRDYILQTFPGIDTLHLEGYNVHYSKSGKGFMFSLFRQMPGLLKTIAAEHEWLKRTVTEKHFDGIISDNRYGLFHKEVPSVIMTHQVLAQTGISNTADLLLSRIHYKRLQQFNQCWVIDVPGNPNLSGKLGHPKRLPANANYLGLLSQITPKQDSEDHLMILLSGPEPQRTILSDLLWQQANTLNQKIVFVEGSNNIEERTNIPAHIQYHKRITKEQLQPLLESAGMVVCRSGYSTLMDLVSLNKKAILIPTPGQTEQEYLGKHLHKEGVFYSAPQKGFNLQQALDATAQFSFKKLPLQNSLQQYTTVIDNWLETLNK